MVNVSASAPMVISGRSVGSVGSLAVMAAFHVLAPLMLTSARVGRPPRCRQRQRLGHLAVPLDAQRGALTHEGALGRIAHAVSEAAIKYPP